MNAIQTPAKGEAMTAAWAAAVTRAANAVGACGTAGMLLRDGDGWQGVEAMPANKRSRAASSDRGCFALGAETHDDALVRCFTNRYYAVGGNVREKAWASDCLVSAFVGSGTVEEGEEYSASDRPFVALVAAANAADGTPALTGYATFAAMAAAAADVTRYVRPLYLLTHAGAVKADFRNMPTMQMVEG